MDEGFDLSNAIGHRYAKALFDLSKEAKSLKAVESQVEELSALVASDASFADFLQSPLVGREEQSAVMAAISKKAKFAPELANTLALMADKRRLPVVGQMAEAFKVLAAEERSELVADVTSAVKLSAAQSKALAETLKAKMGKSVTLNTTIDESLIGGLVVKMGSTMIDSSVKGKLSKLHNAMKEVG